MRSQIAGVLIRSCAQMEHSASLSVQNLQSAAEPHLNTCKRCISHKAVEGKEGKPQDYSAEGDSREVCPFLTLILTESSR